MLLASPVLHHEAETVRVEEQALRVAGARRPQVDHKDHWKLQSLGGMNRQKRNGVGRGRFLGRLTYRELGIDHLVEVAHKVADAGEGEVALEARCQLKHLSQVEQRARAAISCGAELGPSQVTCLLQ